MQQRLVRDLMRIRHGHVVAESSTLRDVAERLIISDCDMVAVTQEDGKFSGVVCESSVVRALMANPAETATIASIVSRHAESVRTDACVSTALPLFRSSANTAVPVVDEAGRVCGLLMRRDVIRSLLNFRVDAAETQVKAQSDFQKSAAITIRPVATSINTLVDSGKAAGSSSAPKPYFMRADEARRILWAAEDRL